MEIISMIAFFIIIFICISISNQMKKQRRESLLIKYNNSEIVEMIMEKRYWQGQTSEQLIDAIGQPVDVNSKILKTKTKETWKYNQIGKGRFALRITLEDGVVIGWDKKS